MEKTREPTFNICIFDNSETKRQKASSIAKSLILHAGAISALVVVPLLFTNKDTGVKVAVSTTVNPSDYKIIYTKIGDDKDLLGGGGGGGDKDKLPASKGGLPKTAMEQFTPPAAVIRNPEPKLPVEPTIVVPPEIQLPKTEGPLGDPLLKTLTPSSGTGSGGGISSGSGGGIGPGKGPGLGPGSGGGTGGGVFRVGGGVSVPECISCPDPKYSEEARKAKHQGTAILTIIIEADGRVSSARVVKPLGMGLDEKVVEAVLLWKFEPAKRNGQPVSVEVPLEVNFRLY